MIPDFSFHHSFQEVAVRAKVVCTCGAQKRAEEKGHRDAPSKHLSGCEVATLYGRWTQTAHKVWEERLKKVNAKLPEVEG